jgi:hypothetical protein
MMRTCQNTSLRKSLAYLEGMRIWKGRTVDLVFEHTMTMTPKDFGSVVLQTLHLQIQNKMDQVQVIDIHSFSQILTFMDNFSPNMCCQ